MGGTGERFFAGDATLTRAVIRLSSGTLGYGYVLGATKRTPSAARLSTRFYRNSRIFRP